MFLFSLILFYTWILQTVESAYDLTEVEALIKLVKEGRTSSECKQLTKQLSTIATRMRKNEEYLEDPVTRFKFLKLLHIEVRENCGLVSALHFDKVGYRANELKSVVKVLINMMESYDLSLEDLSETFQPDESIYIAEFINSLDVADKMKLKYMNMFLENIDEDDMLSEAEEDHYSEVSDLQWDLRNNVDFQKICISHMETQGTKSCRLERRFYENLHIEVLSEDPMATLYHNFLTDFELNIASEEVKKNKFVKGSVRSGEVDFRDQIEEVEDSPFFDNVHQRINRVTGLNSGDDAVMEIFKYRLGGAHTPHTDFYEEDYIRKEVKLGNRVAIAMIFLRETIKGGGFAMPRLNVYVAPTPGTLLVWYNVDKLGRNDEDTVHGGCPVYQGTKMIAITEYKALLQQDVCPINEE